MMLGTFSCVYLPLIYLIWWSIYSNALHIFFLKIGLLVFLLLTHPEFFICSAYKLFIKYMICKNICYFLPACSLSFHSPPASFKVQKFLILIKSDLPMFSFMDHASCIIPKKSFLKVGLRRFPLVFSSTRFIILGLPFRLLI